MKRIFSVLLTTALCAAMLSACAGKSDTAASETAPSSAATSEAATEENPTQIPNPILERESLDKVNEAAGTALKKPAELTVSEESYTTIDGTPMLGQYIFTYNGSVYTLRAAKTQDDISGVYVNGQTLGEAAGDSTETMDAGSGSLWAHWFDGDVQYSLYGENASAEDFAAVRAALQ